LTYYLQQWQARTAADEAGLGKAGTLLDQARARPDDLARWRVALAAVQQAGDALDGGDPGVRRRVESLRDEAQAGADAADRDRKLLDDLVDIRSAKIDDPDGSAIDAAYAGAFREAGIDVAQLSPEEAGERIKARPPAPALAGALDDWASVRRELRHDPAGAGRLARAARVADPDP
jgi:serine/threonine-protein kinase